MTTITLLLSLEMKTLSGVKSLNFNELSGIIGKFLEPL